MIGLVHDNGCADRGVVVDRPYGIIGRIDAAVRTIVGVDVAAEA